MCYTLLSMFEKCLDANYITVENGASYATQREGDTLFILFEHSNGSVDWENNFNWRSQPYSDMQYKWRCHGGFLKVWKSVKPYIEKILEENTDVKSIVVIGYSHGAALAVLCHEYIWYNCSDVRDNIFGFGFGCPRVICGKVPKEVLKRWKNFYVVRNKNDIVTHLPPKLLGFRHIGHLLTVGSGKMGSIDSHRPENYLSELKNDKRCHDSMIK